MEECIGCDGTGKIGEEVCDYCGGTGRLEEVAIQRVLEDDEAEGEEM